MLLLQWNSFISSNSGFVPEKVANMTTESIQNLHLSFENWSIINEFHCTV